MSENELLIPFLTDEPMFVLGWECGTIGALMGKGHRFENYMMHEQNRKQVEVIARHYLYSVKFIPVDEGWCMVDGMRTNAN